MVRPAPNSQEVSGWDILRAADAWSGSGEKDNDGCRCRREGPACRQPRRGAGAGRNRAGCRPAPGGGAGRGRLRADLAGSGGDPEQARSGRVGVRGHRRAAGRHHRPPASERPRLAEARRLRRPERGDAPGDCRRRAARLPAGEPLRRDGGAGASRSLDGAALRPAVGEVRRPDPAGGASTSTAGGSARSTSRRSGIGDGCGRASPRPPRSRCR